ncbi:hypothetical protein [Hyalangium versicolor]|uniref:hypothetical protein n=1 Tax=Hyalangium versicolor TaxID=2861190 RepID=UPI001CCCDD3A|nr:hypothetical protein [Hyalangium versicolor]
MVLLVPMALAARRKPKREREPPQKRTHSNGRFLVLAVVVFVATVVVVTGLRMSSSRETRSSTSTGAPPSGTNPEELAGALVEQWKAMASTVCPRFAALQRGDAGSVSDRAWELASVECIGLICEHPEQLEAKSPGASSRLQPLCQTLSSVMKERWALTVSSSSVRLACPSAMVRWSAQPWSPSNHLSFYREMRGCMERSCTEVVARSEAELYCESAADLAEALGDAPAAARWRQQIQAAPVLQEKGEGQSPSRSVRIMARRWNEACQQGSQKHCQSVAGFCENEREPSDICPHPGKASTPEPRGP